MESTGLRAKDLALRPRVGHCQTFSYQRVGGYKAIYAAKDQGQQCDRLFQVRIFHRG